MINFSQHPQDSVLCKKIKTSFLHCDSHRFRCLFSHFHFVFLLLTHMFQPPVSSSFPTPSSSPYPSFFFFLSSFPLLFLLFLLLSSLLLLSLSSLPLLQLLLLLPLFLLAVVLLPFFLNLLLLPGASSSSSSSSLFFCSSSYFSCLSLDLWSSRSEVGFARLRCLGTRLWCFQIPPHGIVVAFLLLEE